jgi:hypothetical protein
MDNLVKQARRDQAPALADRRRTILGHRRNEVLLGAAALAPAPESKSIASFRKAATAARLKTKKSAGLWRGFEKKLPPPRRKEGSRQPSMVAAPRARPLQATAARWTRAASQGKGSGAPVSGKRGSAAAASSAAKDVPDVIVVDDDLPRAPLKADVLKAWLLAIADGRKVVVKQTKSSIEFKAGAKVPAEFRLSDEFTQNHRGLARSCAG